MSLRSYGSGTSGLAFLGLQETEREAHTKRPLHSLPVLWKSLSSQQLNKSLCCTLFAFGEKVEPEVLKARTKQVNALFRKSGIRVVVPIGTTPLRSVSPIHGKSTKLIMATISTTDYTVIPIDTHRNGLRQLRSFAWHEALCKAVKRAWAIASGARAVRLFHFPQIVIGEGKDVEEALEHILEEEKDVGVDVETTGKDFHSDKLTAFGISNNHVAVSVPWDAYVSRMYGPQPGLHNETIRALVGAILSKPSIRKLFHNGMFDLSVFRSQGIRIEGPIDDTILAHKVAHPDLFHNLQFCMSYEFAIHPWKTVFEQVRKQRDEPGDDWAETDPVELMRYNAQDAAAEVPLWGRVWQSVLLRHRGVENYNELKELATLAAEMQFHGVGIDAAAAAEERRKALIKMAAIKASWETLNSDVPIEGEGSAKAITKLFFETLKAPVLSRSRRTDKEQLSSDVLLAYAVGDYDDRLRRSAFTLYEHRKIKKSYDAFLKPLKEGRVFAKPNVAGTRGTRFSYSEPNLQQWSKEKTIISPLDKKRVELAPNLRHLVLPDDEYVLGEHDYNALEARIVAYAANIPEWIEWLGDPTQDMHLNHVELMFGQRVEKKHPLRQIAKTMTFARFYNRRKSVGQVLKSLKPSMPSLTEDFLLDIFDRFDKARPEVLRWQDKVEAGVRELGYVELPLSGARQYHDPRWPDVNAALSFGIQSTAGNIINAAALRIHRRLAELRLGRILINVHDALIWQALRRHLEAMQALVKEEMERPVNLWGHQGIIFPTECKVGANWRDLT